MNRAWMTAAAAILVSGVATAQDVTREEFERMKKEMEDLLKRLDQDKPLTDQERQDFEKMKKELEELKKKLEQDPDKKTLPGRAEDEAREKAGQVYSKPFLRRFGRGVYIGGYLDLEFINTEDSNDDTFDQHRLVPFIYADVSENIKVAMEIEIEHGGELGIEFAHVDWWWTDEINFRAGMILDPLGKFNLVHDAPFQDLTARPMVDELIIPSVLREPGLGLFGTFDLDPWRIDYEVYVTNGFKGLSKTGSKRIDTSKGFRDARVTSSSLGKLGRDFNDNKSVVGRVSVSPFLGLEFGASAHWGKYDERGDNSVGIYAVDATISGGGLFNKLFSGDGVVRDIFFAIEIVGEFAYADIDRDTRARTAGVPNDFRGYYVEFRYHFMPEFLIKIIPGATDESTFTAVFRWDDTDLDNFERHRITAGLNFRLREDTVIKFEYQWNTEGDRLNEADNDAFLFSVATYF